MERGYVSLFEPCLYVCCYDFHVYDGFGGVALMPFKKISKNKYKSDSGRQYTEKQVKLYYATDGFKKNPKKKKSRSRKSQSSDS